MAQAEADRSAGKRRRGRVMEGAVIALLAAPFVVQCTPVPGCFDGSKSFANGRAFGFRVGMSATEAAAIVNDQYPKVRIYESQSGYPEGGYAERNLTPPIRELAGAAPKRQWRWEKPKGVCWASNRSIVLRFQHDVLTEIVDELDLTLP